MQPQDPLVPFQSVLRGARPPGCHPGVWMTYSVDMRFCNVHVGSFWGSTSLLFFRVSTILFAVGESKGRDDIARCHAPGTMQGTLIPMAVIVGMGFVGNAIGGRWRARRVMHGEFVIDRSIASAFFSSGRPVVLSHINQEKRIRGGPQSHALRIERS